MGFYLEPPTTDRAVWAAENLEQTPVLPSEPPPYPNDKQLVILIGMPHKPLWWIPDADEFKRMWTHMRNPSFERSTMWFYATKQQILDTVPGADHILKAEA